MRCREFDLPNHLRTSCSSATRKVSLLACALSPNQGNKFRFVTGLIYVVIIALWAAVLIPMWLRRHDQISEVRSTARFSSAMRSLGSGSHPDHPAGTGRNLTGGKMARERQTHAQEVAAKRRAVVLGALTLTVLITLLAGLAAMVPMWLPIVAAVPLVAFLIASSLTAPARKSAARPSARVHRVAPARSRIEVEMDAVAPRTRDLDDFESWDPWAEDDQSWEAVPTTLPTYVTAPRATSMPRALDRSVEGEWTGSAMVETARAMRRPRVTAADLAEPAPATRGADETAEIPVVAQQRSTAMPESATG